jgi:hypothetical protein
MNDYSDRVHQLSVASRKRHKLVTTEEEEEEEEDKSKWSSVYQLNLTILKLLTFTRRRA